MDKYICKECNTNFKSKQSLERHENKKFKCNKTTEYKCDNCNKCFVQKKNLIEHQLKKTCNKKIIINDIEYENKKNDIINDNIIVEILINNDNDQIFLLKTIGLNLPDEEIKKILNSNMTNTSKLGIIKNKINELSKEKEKNNTILNNNSNNNSNNTINNININNFGNENIDYLTPKYYEKLLKNNYGKDSFLKLSNEIYLNKDKPNNNTIKIDNLNNKYCKIVENNKWITTTKESAFKKLHITVSSILISMMEEDINNKIPENRKKIIIEFLEKDVDDYDEIIKETLDQLLLDIYNYYN